MDRGKSGSKLHILPDAAGLPLVVELSAANTPDGHRLKPMVTRLQLSHEPVRGEYRKPGKLHADKAYDHPELQRRLGSKRIEVRIAREVKSSTRLGRHRWVIERTIAWLFGYRRLSPRYERHPDAYLAFLTLAAVVTCYKRYLKLTI
ncbi:IS5 family transposase [Planobispora siamensis]|uniref:IS5 family transposase n=1 Tax=Planobispora siamensis TaxID=936338 RepID=A0A8J3WPU5_9ACTN|nr:IS5 family transposase [Planobispora siamensis]